LILVFSLPFCLLLPDGDYQIRLDKDEVVTLNLTKVTPKIFDERIPCRSFLKGELENIDQLKIWDEKSGGGGWVSVDQLEHIEGKKVIIEYKTKDGKEIVPIVEPSIIEKDVDISQDVYISPDKFAKLFNLDYLGPEIINRMISDLRYGHATGRRLVVNAEVRKDRYGRIRYTKVRFISNKI
jgi:hypothetical protein